MLRIRITKYLAGLTPRYRRLCLILIDATLIPISLWLSLRHPFHGSPLIAELWLLPSALLIGLPLYALTGQYKGLTRYVGSLALYHLAGRNSLLILLMAGVGWKLNLSMPPRSTWILLWLLLTGFTGAVRFILRDMLLSMRSAEQRTKIRVAIYGAGYTGVQLSKSIQATANHQIVTFLDDAPALWRRTINGIPIQPPQVLSQLQGELDQLLIAIPSLTRSERRRIFSDLQCHNIPVMLVPSVDDLTSGRAHFDVLRPVAIEELLGRNSVPPKPELLGPGINNSVICVTGAGGSIGSELCRQILQLYPKLLILLENSEPSLYTIDQELQKTLPKDVQLLPVLGSAANAALVKHLFAQHGVQIVFHAAAYKHVPLVEANPLAGLANNVDSTRFVCQAATEYGLNEVILISTDKAVRPTNVMGASKRLAELVVQAFALESTQAANSAGQPCTRFSMVRFGNVLGSSGSVVPLFRQQIASGGPITLTHPKVIRYFMTIPEAAQLVLQAAVLAVGGDVFLLDMGKPLLIKDLAEQMVRLSGLSVRDEKNPNGDIEIICTGLRPGEKLYEELLIDAESEKTQYPLIYRAKEKSISPDLLWPHLDALDDALAAHDQDAALEILSELVPEWER